MKILAIHDLKANTYLKPFADSSTINAIRGFESLVNEPKSIVNQYPDDFRLVELADFDEQTGTITLNNPKDLGTARSVLKQLQ